MVVFVHGWHHNADLDHANLNAFREVLHRLTLPGSHVRAPVLGIYIGWRGEVFTKEWSKRWLANVSFWNREAVAHHIGARAGETLLCELNARVSRLRDSGTSVTMVTIGHSFGALLVLTAVAAEMVDYSHCEYHPFCWPPMRAKVDHAFGDLVVLINPAVEAERFVPFDVYSRQARGKSDSATSILVLASDGDMAVKYAFPVGRFISTLFRPMRTWAWRAEHEALGVYPRQLTHRLALSATSVDGVCNQETPELKLCRLPHVENGGAPFIVARVPRELVPGHSAIYDPRLQAFLVNYIAQLTEYRGFSSTSE